MSAARRRAHRGLVASQRGQTRLRRRAESCRVVHWRRMWEGRTLEPMRRPHDQDVRVGFIVVRCPEHRRSAANLTAAIVVSRNEEFAATGIDALKALVDGRRKIAERTVLRMLVPFRFRREMGVS